MDRRVAVGMQVVDADGKRLGRVTRCGPSAFEVVRRFWSPYEWVIRWDEILAVTDGTVRVARSDDSLLELAAGGLPHAWPRVQPPESDVALTSAPPEGSSGEPVVRPAAPPREDA